MLSIHLNMFINDRVIKNRIGDRSFLMSYSNILHNITF